MKVNVLFRKLSLSMMLVLSFNAMNSCSNNEEVTFTEKVRLQEEEGELLTFEESNDSDILLPDGNYSFIFEGKDYSYTLVNGNVECDNNTLKILNYLQDFGDNLITSVNNDMVIEYFISNESYNKKFQKKNKIEEKYRTTSMTLYRNKKYRGSRAHYHFDSRNGENKTNTGVSWGITAIKGQVDHVDTPYAALFNVDFYEQDNLTGRSLRYNLNASPLSISNLKSVPLYPGSSENWNDRIKSLRMY